MSIKDQFCEACGWNGDPEKVRVKSEFRRKKTGCPACGSEAVVLASSRARLPKPNLVIQPQDPVITKLLKQAAACAPRTQTTNRVPPEKPQ